MEPHNVIIKEQNSEQDYFEETDIKLNEDQYLQFSRNEHQQLDLLHPHLEQQYPSKDPLERSNATSNLYNMAKGGPTIADVMRELLEMKQEIHEVKLINEGLKVQQKELVKIIAENSVLVKKLRKDPYSNVKGISFKQSIFPIKTKEILFKLEADLQNNEKEISSKQLELQREEIKEHNVNIKAETPDLVKDLNKYRGDSSIEENEDLKNDTPFSSIEENEEHFINIPCISPVEEFNCNENIFPVETKAALFQLEAAFKYHESKIVSEMKKIVGDAKLKRAFDRLFTLELILQFNLRGVQNKESFEKLKNLNAALYKVLYKEGYTQDEYQADVRDAFRLLKNRFHKINHSIRKRESGSMY